MPSEKQDSKEELTTRFRFPRPETADEDGFLAVGGDLKAGTLLLAYRNGIFPWTTRPVTWWSPDPRAIIPMGGMHVSRSLRKVIRRGRFSTSFDRAFRAVMQGCAEPRPGRDIRRSTERSAGNCRGYLRVHRDQLLDARVRRLQQ